MTTKDLIELLKKLDPTEELKVKTYTSFGKADVVEEDVYVKYDKEDNSFSIIVCPN